MAKLLGRIGTNKFYCHVSVEVIRVNLQVDMPTKMQVNWSSGSTNESSDSFEVKPSESEQFVDLKFRQVGTFFREKDGTVQERLCSFELASNWPAKKSYGTCEFNLAPIIRR